MQQLETSVDRYLAELDRADREPTMVTETRTSHIKRKIGTIREKMQRLEALKEEVADSTQGHHPFHSQSRQG